MVTMNIFDLPNLYKIKVSFLKKINKFDFTINPLVNNKTVLDIGCGSYQFIYDPNITKSRIGIDVSKSAIEKANKIYPKSQHLVISADKLPFADKEFDTSLLLFVLHHIPYAKWKNILLEAKRVSRESIIIVDHKKNDNLLPRLIQTMWWQITDRGEQYSYKKEWVETLKNFKISEYKEMGTLFNNICFYNIDLK